MDGNIKIIHFEVKEHYVVLLDCLFKHFKNTKNLEFDSDCTNAPNEYFEDLGLFSCVGIAIMGDSTLNTFYILDGFSWRLMKKIKRDISKFRIKYLHKAQTVQMIALLPNLNTLYIYELGDLLERILVLVRSLNKKSYICVVSFPHWTSL